MHARSLQTFFEMLDTTRIDRLQGFNEIGLLMGEAGLNKIFSLFEDNRYIHRSNLEPYSTYC